MKNYYKTVDELLNLKKFKLILINEKHKSIIESELLLIFKNCSKKELRNRLGNIYNFIYYDVDNSISWIDRLKIIQNELKNDSSSLHSLEIRYGKVEALNKFNEKNNKCVQTLEKYILRYGEVNGKLKWRKKNELNGQSLENYILRYGEEIGKIKYEDYLKRRNLTYKKNRLNGKKYDNGQSLENYILRYGEEIGSLKHEERFSWYKYRFSKNYYIDTFGKIIGEDKWLEYIKSMSKTSLVSFIKRYGESIGTEKLNELAEKKRYNNSLEHYVEKYGENGLVEWNTYRDKTIFKKQNYSMISQKLFWELFNKLSDYIKNICYFAELNSEYFIKVEGSIIFLDFKAGNAVIEFDGEYWHSFENMIIKDNFKDKKCSELGMKMLRIKERDYLNNKNDICIKCLNFINNNYE